MNYPTWKGIPIIGVTKSAEDEMEKLGIYTFQLENMLKKSFPCERKRRKGIHERCIKKKNKVLKIVLEEMTSRRSGRKYWRIRHAGIFTLKKGRLR